MNTKQIKFSVILNKNNNLESSLSECKDNSLNIQLSVDIRSGKYRCGHDTADWR